MLHEQPLQVRRTPSTFAKAKGIAACEASYVSEKQRRNCALPLRVFRYATKITHITPYSAVEQRGSPLVCSLHSGNGQGYHRLGGGGGEAKPDHHEVCSGSPPKENKNVSKSHKTVEKSQTHHSKHHGGGNVLRRMSRMSLVSSCHTPIHPHAHTHEKREKRKREANKCLQLLTFVKKQKMY